MPSPSQNIVDIGHHIFLLLLIVFDDPGGGTDPAEGGALAGGLGCSPTRVPSLVARTIPHTCRSGADFIVRAILLVRIEFKRRRDTGMRVRGRCSEKGASDVPAGV